MHYCENCGAKDGESVKQNMEIAGDSPQGDGHFRVSATDRGILCQFCQEHPNVTRYYSPMTGVVVLTE